MSLENISTWRNKNAAHAFLPVPAGCHLCVCIYFLGNIGVEAVQNHIQQTHAFIFIIGKLPEIVVGQLNKQTFHNFVACLMPGEEGAHTVLQKTCIFIVLKIGCDKLPGHLNGEDQGAAIQSAYLMEVHGVQQIHVTAET